MIDIKQYQQEDDVRQQLLEILQAVDNVFVPPLSQRKPLEFWLDLFNMGVVLYALDEENGTAAGFLAYYPQLDEHIYKELQPYVNIAPVVTVESSQSVEHGYRGGYLHFIAVSPRYRGKKIASLLLEALSKDCRTRAICSIRVITWSTNRTSLELYKKHDFYPFHRIADDRGKGIDSVYLETRCPAPPLRRLGELLRQVQVDVPFYREKYRRVSFDPDAFNREVFESLPYFTRDEYRSRKHLDDLYFPMEESHYVFISGGSTGISKASFWNVGYIEKQISILAHTFLQLGISPRDRALNLFNPGMSGTHYGFNLALEKVGAAIIPLGGDTQLPVIARFALDLKVTVLIGNPAMLILVLEHLAAQQPDFMVNTIIYAGENLSQVQYDFMKRHARHIFSPIYSSTETGIIGTQCREIPAGTFHLSDSVYVELIDPGTGELTTANSGEVVVTSLQDRTAPCIRYRLGDNITFLERPCTCGSIAPLFRLEGRVDDAVTIGSTHWSYDEIVLPLVRYLDSPGTISSNISLFLEERARKVRMTLRYQICNGTGEKEAKRLEEKIRDFMAHRHPVVGPLVSKNVIHPVEVERIASFESLRNPQTGKIRFVEDSREKQIKRMENVE